MKKGDAVLIEGTVSEVYEAGLAFRVTVIGYGEITVPATALTPKDAAKAPEEGTQ